MNEDQVPFEAMPLHPIWCIEESALNKIIGASRGLTADSMPMPESFDNDRFQPMKKAGSVAIIDIRGPLTKNVTFMTYYYGGTSTELARRAVNASAGDKDIETIFLNVDSPGGSVDGIAGLVDAIIAAAKIKRPGKRKATLTGCFSFSPHFGCGDNQNLLKVCSFQFGNGTTVQRRRSVGLPHILR